MILFDDLGLPYDKAKDDEESETKSINHPKPLKTTKKTPKKSSMPRISKALLIALSDKHPLPRIILAYRLSMSYLQIMLYPLMKVPATRRLGTTKRLNPTFDTLTLTGRIFTEEPNLQNLPHRMHVEELDGHATYDLVIRKCFRPSHGSVLVAGDYSHIELRIFAHLSKDPPLVSAFNSNEDVFTRLTGEWFDVPSQEVSPVMRNKTKAVCYSVLYGIGARSLSVNIETSVEEAELFIREFKAKHQVYVLLC